MLIVHLFISYAHVNLCHFFSSSWCRGLAAVSACGSSWTFLFTFTPIGFHGNNGADPATCIHLLKIYVVPVLTLDLEIS